MAKIILFPNSGPRKIVAQLDAINDLPVQIELLVPGRVALEIVKILEAEQKKANQ